MDSKQETLTAADLAARQQAREPIAFERAERKMAKVKPAIVEAAGLFRSASRASRPTKRIKLVLEAASAWAAPIAKVSACRRGCAHCCYIPVVITSAEARLLSSHTGRPLRQVDGVRVNTLTTTEGEARANMMAEGAEFVGKPCPFLRGGECSVYDIRPLACRTHFNLDDDALLCERVEGHPASVPYVDTREVWAASLTLQPQEVLADIRSFFGDDEEVES